MKLVENWKEAWRWYSMRAAAIGAGVLSAWPMLPDEWKAALPEWSLSALGVATLLTVAVGRVVDQGGGRGNGQD